ncbi:MAG: hypothetical protein AAGA47_03770 [Pseudomonadota bacterium]
MLIALPLIAAAVARFGLKSMGETSILWFATTLAAITALLGWFSLLSDATEPAFLVTWAESGTLSTAMTIGVSGDIAPWVAGFTSLMFLSQLSVHGWTLPKGAWTKGASYRAPLTASLALFSSCGLFLLMATDLAQIVAGAALVAILASSLTGFDHRRQAAGRASQRLLVICLGSAVALLLAAGLAYVAVDSSELALVLKEPLEGFSVALVGTQAELSAVAAVLIALFSIAWLGQVPLHAWLRLAGASPGPVLPVLVLGVPWLALFLLTLFSPMLSAFEPTTTYLTAFGGVSAVLLGAMALGEIDIRKAVACLAGVQAGFALLAFTLVGPALAISLFIGQALSLALLAWGAAAVFQARDHDGIHDGELAEMGGLRAAMPWAYGAMVLGAAGISSLGLPFVLNGAIIGIGGFSALATLFGAAFGGWVFWAILVAALLSSIAAWRTVVLAFHGPVRKVTEQSHSGATDAGWPSKAIFLLTGAGLVAVSTLGTTSLEEGSPDWIVAIPVLTFVVGLATAALLAAGKRYNPLGALFADGISIEKGYQSALIGPGRWLGQTAVWLDGALHDRVLSVLAERVLPLLQRAMARPGTKRVAPYALGTAVAVLLVSTLAAMVGA